MSNALVWTRAGAAFNANGLAKNLLLAAWVQEVAAVAIGIGIAAGTAYDIHAEGEGIGALDIFLGAMPFLMVAVAELCKIPLVLSTYHAVGVHWRALFATGLLFLMLITFETVLNGGERSFAGRIHPIEQLKKEQLVIDQTVAQKRGEIEDLQGVSADLIRTEYTQTLSDLESSREKALAALTEQHELDMDRLGSSMANALPAGLVQLNEELARLDATHQTNTERLAKTLESELERAVVRSAFSVLPARLNGRAGPGVQYLVRAQLVQGQEVLVYERQGVWVRISARREEPLWVHGQYLSSHDAGTQAAATEHALALRARHDEQLAALSAAYRTERSRLLGQRDAAMAEYENVLAEREASRRAIQQAFRARRDEVLSEFAGQQAQPRARYDQRMAEVAQREARISALSGEITALERDHIKLGEQMNALAARNQIYRLAMLVFGRQTPEAVTKDELKIVATVWFGSLAAIVAWTGPLLAFASCVIGHPRRASRPSVASGEALAKLLRSLRRLVVRWRRLRTRTRIVFKEKEVPVTHVVTEQVEVIKEVPVDRVIIQKVPEIVEKVVIKYVPVYTNDPELLAQGYPADEGAPELSLVRK